MNDLRELVGKRILMVAKEKSWPTSESIVREFKICEISPSGKWVKIMDDYGKKYWKVESDIVPIEVLQFDERPKP